MTRVSQRIAIAVAALATLTLSACAVSGQGDPGVAATYGDRVVTNQQVLDYGKVFVDFGTPATGPGVALTLLLLGPDLLSAAQEHGFTVTDDEVTIAARVWARYGGQDGDPTPGMLAIAREELALIHLLKTDAGFAAVQEITRNVEDSAVISPRYGAFSGARFEQTIVAALNEAISKELGTARVLFAAFYQLDGFTQPIPAWVSGG